MLMQRMSVFAFVITFDAMLNFDGGIDFDANAEVKCE